MTAALRHSGQLEMGDIRIHVTNYPSGHCTWTTGCQQKLKWDELAGYIMPVKQWSRCFALSGPVIFQATRIQHDGKAGFVLMHENTNLRFAVGYQQLSEDYFEQ